MVVSTVAVWNIETCGDTVRISGLDTKVCFMGSTAEGSPTLTDNLNMIHCESTLNHDQSSVCRCVFVPICLAVSICVYIFCSFLHSSAYLPPYISLPTIHTQRPCKHTCLHTHAYMYLHTWKLGKVLGRLLWFLACVDPKLDKNRLKPMNIMVAGF